MTGPGMDRSAVRAVSLWTGPQEAHRFAHWSSEKKTKAGCLHQVTRRVNFPDGLYPIRIDVAMDHCVWGAASRRDSAIVVLVLIVFIAVMVFVIMKSVFQLVMTSLKQASEVLRPSGSAPAVPRLNGHFSAEPAGVQKIVFEPVRMLAERAMESIRLERQAAVAQVVQTLVHDVRRPMTLLRMMTDSLQSCASPAEAAELLHHGAPEILAAMDSVDGMMTDILEAGATRAPKTARVSARRLLSDSLKQALRVHTATQVVLHDELRHSFVLNVDQTKCARVFSNIFSNALQAMSSCGSLWLISSDVGDAEKPFVRIGIRNSGSSVRAEDLPLLFDAFYTSNKPGGTGLGLAIVKKIVTEHGGEVSCHSAPVPSSDGTGEQPSVTFWVTLPALLSVDDDVTPLPVTGTSGFGVASNAQ